MVRRADSDGVFRLAQLTRGELEGLRFACSVRLLCSIECVLGWTGWIGRPMTMRDPRDGNGGEVDPCSVDTIRTRTLYGPGRVTDREPRVYTYTCVAVLYTVR